MGVSDTSSIASFMCLMVPMITWMGFFWTEVKSNWLTLDWLGSTIQRKGRSTLSHPLLGLSSLCLVSNLK